MLLLIILETLTDHRLVNKLIKMYKNGTLAKIYKSKEFKQYQKSFSLYPPPGSSVTDEALDPTVLPYDQEKIVHQVMMIKVTRQIGQQNIALTHWF